MRWAEESSSEEEVEQKRVVRSHTDKRYDQLIERIKQLSNHLKIDDFSSLISDYEAIIKMLDKLKTIVEQDGGPPSQFVKAICSLEEYVDKTHADLQEKKQNKGEKLTESKQKAFNTLRAKVRKGNRAFQDHIERFKENPQEFESEAESEEGKDEDSDSDSDAGPAAKSSDSDSDSSSSDSDSDSDSGSSDSSDSDSDSKSGSDSASSKSDGSSDAGGDAEAALEKKMLRWVITPDLQKKRDKEKEDKDAAKRSKKDDKDDKKNKKRGGLKRGSRHQERDAGEAQKSNKEDFTAEEIMKKVSEIAQSRGKRGFDRNVYFDKLRGWLTHAQKHGPLEQLYIHSEMVAADFDGTGGTLDHMKIERWNEAIDKIQVMLPLLVESYRQRDDGAEDKPEADEGAEELWSLKTQQERFVASAEKLDKELYKALQFTVDVYGDEYQQILANSSKFMVLLKRMFKFFEETKQAGPLGVVASRLLEHLYYKPDLLNAAVYDAIRHSLPEEEHADWMWPEDSRPLMAKLCHCVFVRAQATDELQQLDQPKLQTRASLAQAFHLALHDHFQEARDLLHLGNLAEKSVEHDVHTAILYNRTLAQMGLCAFRMGKIQDAHNCLMDVCMHNKARELLAQGLVFSKNIEKTQEQERAERERQLPYHMHINLEVLESAHHICAMLLEIPNMAMESIVPTSKRVISRVLRRALESQEKQVFAGPPENAKEAVVSAARALQKGDWVIACSMLEDLKLWEHIDLGHPENGAKIKDMIKEKIKIEALRTYLFSYASIYDAFHIEQLVGMFGLDEKIVHSVVSKMMIKEEITAFWDESSKYVLVQHVEPSPLQRLSLLLADRAALCVQHNEQLVDQKTHCGYGLNGRNLQDLQSGAPGKGGKGARNSQGMPGKGGKGSSKGKSSMSRPVGNRGWENARAGALRSAQRGWARPA
jgi:translation initiation factor 3 subunit C